MATINLGSIKFNWRGAYASGTAYAVDDVVSSGGSSYVCILASTGNAVSNGTYWEQMSAAGTNGTNGTDLTSTLTAQGDIVYRDGSGLAKLGAGTSGQVLQTGGTGANPSWTNAPSGVLKKQHYIEYSTRTAGSASANVNQFTWTSSFVPLDPVNNDLYVQAIVPTYHAGNDYAGYGLRFSKSGGSDYDFFGRGIQYVDAATMYMSIQSQIFNIPAGTIPAGTYTIYLRTETGDSQASQYNPNSSDQSRLATQTRSTLMISEWKN